MTNVITIYTMASISRAKFWGVSLLPRKWREGAISDYFLSVFKNKSQNCRGWLMKETSVAMHTHLLPVVVGQRSTASQLDPIKHLLWVLPQMSIKAIFGVIRKLLSAQRVHSRWRILTITQSPVTNKLLCSVNGSLGFEQRRFSSIWRMFGRPERVMKV